MSRTWQSTTPCTICQIYFSFNKEALKVISLPGRLLSKGTQTSLTAVLSVWHCLWFFSQKSKYLEQNWGLGVSQKGFFYLCCHSSLCRLSHFSHVWPFATWTIALQSPMSLVFSRQEYCSRLSCPSPWDLPNPGIKPVPLMSPALASGFFTASAIWEDWILHCGEVRN